MCVMAVCVICIVEEGQKLYVRLFGRQHRWLRQGKIVYPKIAADLTEVLAELVAKGLLLNGKT